MTAIILRPAKSNRSRLVEAIALGREREIVIARDGRPAAKRVPLSGVPPVRRIGVAQG